MIFYLSIELARISHISVDHISYADLRGLVIVPNVENIATTYHSFPDVVLDLAETFSHRPIGSRLAYIIPSLLNSNPLTYVITYLLSRELIQVVVANKQ